MTLAEKLRAQAEKKAKKRGEKKNGGTSSEAPELPTDLPTNKYSVKTHELVRQAELIAKNGKIKIPETILRVVKRAIQARKRCTAWFSKTGVDNGHSTEGHVHFIEILERIIDMLTEDESVNATTEKKATDEPPTPSTMKYQDFSGSNNRFSNLEIEETDDSADTSATLQDLSATSTVSKGGQRIKTTKIIDIVEAELDNAFDRAFQIFCFFEDLHKIQDFLNETWESYKLGDLDLITAAMTTNAAFDIVRREEEAVFSSISSVAPGSKPRYLDLAPHIFFTDSFRNPSEELSPGEKAARGMRITPFDNFVYLPVARTLMKYEPFAKRKVLVCRFYPLIIVP